MHHFVLNVRDEQCRDPEPQECISSADSSEFGVVGVEDVRPCTTHARSHKAPRHHDKRCRSGNHNLFITATVEAPQQLYVGIARCL